MTKNPVLALPDFGKVFQVDYDANGTTIGAMHWQEGKLIALFNEKLNDAKKKYLVYDQEIYAIIQALKWRHYLLPKEYFFYIDQQALK